MMILMVDKPNTTPIGQDRETLTFKALLYLYVVVQVQVCGLFLVVISHCSAWLSHYNEYFCR